MTQPTLAPVLTVDDVAELLHCAPRTVQERARRGDLPGLRWGDDWVFPAGALLKRLDEVALADASERRKPAAPTAVVLRQVPTKARRQLPVLPSV